MADISKLNLTGTDMDVKDAVAREKLTVIDPTAGSGLITFGVDSNGNYGYKKVGADTVTPFRTGGGDPTVNGSLKQCTSNVGYTGGSITVYYLPSRTDEVAIQLVSTLKLKANKTYLFILNVYGSLSKFDIGTSNQFYSPSLMLIIPYYANGNNGNLHVYKYKPSNDIDITQIVVKGGFVLMNTTQSCAIGFIDIS